MGPSLSQYYPKKGVNFLHINYITRCIELDQWSKYEELLHDPTCQYNSSAGLLSFFLKLSKSYKREKFYVHFYLLIDQLIKKLIREKEQLLANVKPRVLNYVLKEKQLLRWQIEEDANNNHQTGKIITPFSPDYKKVRFNARIDMKLIPDRNHPDYIAEQQGLPSFYLSIPSFIDH